MKADRKSLIYLIVLLGAFATGFTLARLTGNVSAGTSVDAPEISTNDDAAGKDAAEDEAGENEDGLIALTRQQIEVSGLQVVPVSRGGGSQTRLNGRVEYAIGAHAAIAAAIGGRVERVIVAPGSKIVAGQPLAVIVSGEAAALRASVDAVRAEAEAARRVYQRDQALMAQGVVARQELEASYARTLAAEAAARAAAAQLVAAGSPGANGQVNITSSITGVVSAVQVTPGSVIAAGDTVARVADPTKTELVFFAPPMFAAQIEAGTRIEAKSSGSHFSAVVIGVAVDRGSQGGMAIIRARPESVAPLPAGMPVSGIVVAAAQDNALTVPADAVQTVEGRSVVFVANGDKGFRAIPVLVGRRAGGHIEILKGLSGDERVVGSNAFLLKAELAKGESGHAH